MNEKWVIIGSNHYHQLQVFGTSTGRTFKSEKAAERLVRQLEKVAGLYHLDWLVMDINEAPETGD